MYVRPNWFFMLFKSSVSLLMFCLIVLSILESGTLKSPVIIGESEFNSVHFYFMNYGILLLGEYVYNCYSFVLDQTFHHYKMFLFVSTNISVTKSILSDMCIATLALFQVLFAWCIFFYHFTLNLFEFLNLNVSLVERIWFVF